MDEIIRQALIDEEAMHRLLNELEPFVYRVSYHVSREQTAAEEIAAAVLHTVCTELGSFRGATSLQTWIYSLVMKTHRAYAKRHPAATVSEAESLPPSPEQTSVQTAAQTPVQTLHHLLADLSELDRQIVVLRFQNGLSVREIAEIIRQPEHRVTSRVFHLKDRLQGSFRRGGEVL